LASRIRPNRHSGRTATERNLHLVALGSGQGEGQSLASLLTWRDRARNGKLIIIRHTFLVEVDLLREELEHPFAVYIVAGEAIATIVKREDLAAQVRRCTISRRARGATTPIPARASVPGA